MDTIGSKSMQRINAHMLIGDPRSAATVAANALLSDANNRVLHQAYIRALAKCSDEKPLFAAFLRYSELFNFTAEKDKDLCEAIAWGIISAGELSDSPIVRLYALIAAFHGADAKSIDYLERGCADSNFAVRSAAVQLISHMRDAPLCRKIKHLYKTETNWKVHIEVIKAIGAMKIHECLNELMALVSSNDCRAEEKAAAISSLVLLLEDIDRAAIMQLSVSDRAGLRLLACEVIAHLQSERDVDLLWKLSADNSYEVRSSALRSLGLLTVREYNGQSMADLARERCRDPNKDVSLTAAWLLTLHEPNSAIPAFDFWLKHELPEVRQQAAAVISATGAYGVSYMQQCFHQSDDPCIKLILALGLIQQGVDIQESCDVLYQEFAVGEKRWKWDEDGHFRILVQMKNFQSDDPSLSAEEIYQLTRLEILNLLAVMKYPKIEQAIQAFLQKKIWGISGLATAVLLTEGDSEALSFIENFLENSPQAIKVQAALILALWGRSEKAINVLQQSYSTADRQTKEKILEGMGRIGSLSSLPFLLERLQDPQQTLRLIAAAAILQCLYH